MRLHRTIHQFVPGTLVWTSIRGSLFHLRWELRAGEEAVVVFQRPSSWSSDVEIETAASRFSIKAQGFLHRSYHLTDVTTGRELAVLRFASLGSKAEIAWENGRVFRLAPSGWGSPSRLFDERGAPLAEAAKIKWYSSWQQLTLHGAARDLPELPALVALFWQFVQVVNQRRQASQG